MATTSVVPAFKAALVTALTAAAAPVFRRWHPNITSEGIFLSDASGATVINALKAGRQRREETSQVQIVCQTFTAGQLVDAADDSEARCFELLAEVEDVLANDPDVSSTCQYADDLRWTEDTVPFEHGWATRITATVTLKARLT